MIESKEAPPEVEEAPAVASGGGRPPRALPGRPAAVAAVVLIAALAGGAVAAGVTLGILQSRSRTNPQLVDIRNNVTISASDAVTNVASKALPAVVSVVTGTNASGVPEGGSGFLVTSDGYVVTAIPVVASSARLTVLVQGDPRAHEARLIDFDCQSGIAVLKAQGITGAPTLAFGDSAALKPGETVVGLGGRLGGAQVAAGVVSGLNSPAGFAAPQDPSRQLPVSGAVLTSIRSAGAGGMTGGPLLNVGGQVVGVLVPADASESALPAALLQGGVQQVVSGEKLAVPALGGTWSDVSAVEAAATGAPAGALLTAVTPGEPAASAGLRQGDVITQVDEVQVDDAHPLALDLRTRFQIGQRVTVSYTRRGFTQQVQLTLASEHPTCL